VWVAVVLGLLMLVEALGLLALGWQRFELGNRDGRLQTFAFQTLLFFALFSIVSIRERRRFWASRPGGALALALAGDACVGLFVGVHGLAELRPLPLHLTALIVAYSGACFLVVNDAVKIVLMARAARPASGAPASQT